MPQCLYEGQKQLVVSSSLLPALWSQGHNTGSQFDSKHIYPLSYLACLTSLWNENLRMHLINIRRMFMLLDIRHKNRMSYLRLYNEFMCINKIL